MTLFYTPNPTQYLNVTTTLLNIKKFTFTFIHLADAFIQSNLQYIQVIIFFCQYVCSLGIKPTSFALLTQCSTTGTLY